MVEIQTFKVKGSARQHIMDIIEILGAKRSGAGAYATTYGISSKEVIKVFSDDRGYMYYLESIAKMTDNSYVPCINYIHKFVDRHRDTWYMVSMERLSDFDTLNQAGRVEFHYFRDLVKEYVGDDYDPECVSIQDLPRELIKVALPKTLLQVMDVIRDGNYKEGLGFDLHSGNIMLRTGGDLVITDPLVY